MMRSRNCIATDAALLLAGLLFACAAVAAPAAGTVTQLSGALFVQQANGHAKVIARDSAVEPGDTLVTGHDAYAEVRLADGTSMILEPDTQLAIDAFSYDASRKADDDARLTLARGGMQVTSGAIAARSAGHQKLATPLGTIEVTPSKFIIKIGASAPATVAMNTRVYLALNSTETLSDASNEIFIAQNVPPNPGPSGGLNPGLYVQVLDGVINLTNKGGSTNFTAGQFGFTGSLVQPPVVIPANPGIQFTPPPSFSSTTQPGGSTTGTTKANTVDCEVR